MYSCSPARAVYNCPRGTSFSRRKYCNTRLYAETRVAPRLTENWVPGGGYPERSAPEMSLSNSRNRGYLYPGYPSTGVPRYVSTVLYGGPTTGVYVDLHSSGCASRLSPLAPPCRLQDKSRKYPHSYLPCVPRRRSKATRGAKSVC